MAINRFAILTDGFGKPGTIAGTDWSSTVGRALLVTEGYFNRAFSGAITRIISALFLYQFLKGIKDG